MTLSRKELIDLMATAIDGADVGYRIRLTRLVGDESTYTLTFGDGSPALEFSSYEDAADHAKARRRQDRATAALSVLDQAGMVIVPRQAAQEFADFGRWLNEKHPEFVGECQIHSFPYSITVDAFRNIAALTDQQI